MASFRFLRIQCTVHPSFLLILLVFTGLYRDPSIENLITGMILIVSLLVHEYGHALAALYFGAKPEIHLEAFGGTTNYSSIGSEKKELIVTIAGPLLESVLILVPYFFLRFHYFENNYINHILYVTMKLNIFWLMFNIIPVLPLDGGKIAKYFLDRFWSEKGVQASLILGIIATVIGIPYYLFEGCYVFGSLLFFFGLNNLKAYQAGVGMENPNPFILYNKGNNYLENNEIGEAKRIFKKLLKSTEKSIRMAGLESLVTILCKENKENEAYQLLLREEVEGFKDRKCLLSVLCKLAYKENNFALIVKYSREIYEIEPTSEIALLNSKAFASLNNPVLAAGWLQTASLFKELSKQVLNEILGQEVYDQVRQHEAFQSSVLEQ